MGASQGDQCKRIQIKPQGGAWGNGCIDPHLLAVNAAETDAFSVVAIQYFDGVAVEITNDGASRKPKGCQFSLQRVRYARIR